MKNKTIKIGFKEYEIVKKPEVISEHCEAYGQILMNDEIIEISSNYNQNQQNATLIHEMIHAIFDKLDMHELNSNEVVVNQVATELYLTIKNNPHIFKMSDV